ncbi:MAG: glycosyltransferase [Candidatus Marinimicrobia bacterium]|nr:glycosyltransferase [Candidatus Neomarinimicrobiota bacterium]MCF7828374.1 glycosyltransferase [Candidatus Neomarinimicrobiota bacterium]MCF7881032.1 glycosyltransferase [Candidatus Neomarinimicrobiota bacterium]
MKIVMFTNTYTPHVGGVAGSVHQITEDLQSRGHQVIVVAPEFPDMPEDEQNVIRIPAIQNFNGSDFSVSLPAPIQLRERLDDFGPDIIHSHHPYLLGDTALRISASRNLPLVFTHHTMYEKYTHYVPADSPLLKRFVIELSIGFVNLCDHVIAPSDSVADIIRERGAETDITVIPTGVDYDRFSSGNGEPVREKYGIPQDAFLLGHVGRLAPEKNLEFLAEATAKFLEDNPNAHFLIVGEGPSEEQMEYIFQNAGVGKRAIFTGVQKDQNLVDCYTAMDVLVFSSKSETQGMVLAEAMAAGSPVVALEAPGASDIIRNGKNGILLDSEDVSAFADAIAQVQNLSPETFNSWLTHVNETAREFSADRSAEKIIEVYTTLHENGPYAHTVNDTSWHQFLRAVQREWDIWEKRINAGVQSISHQEKSGN